MINIGLGGHGEDHRDSDNQCPLWYVISFPVPDKAVMSEKGSARLGMRNSRHLFNKHASLFR